MQQRLKQRKSKKTLRVIIILSAVLAGTIAYYWLWYHPDEINSGIAVPETVFKGHHNEIWAAKFIPGTDLIASGSVDSTVQVWNSRTGKIFHTLRHLQGVTNVSVSNNGKLIASASYDGMVRVWNVADGSLVRELTGSQGTVWSVAFDAHDSLIAACGEDKTVRLWRVADGTLLHEMKGHTLNVWAVKFSPDGGRIISAGFDKTIRVWNSATGALIRILEGHTEAIVDLAVSHDGRLLASGSDDKTIRLWNLHTLTLEKILQGGDEHVQALSFSPNDERLASGGRDKNMIGELLQNFFGDSHYNKGVSMRLWNVKSGTVLQTFAWHANDVNDVDYNPGGTGIVSASSDKTAVVWKIVK